MAQFHKRVIGGYLKGKKIELPALDVTRSSKSILKESFFNTVQFEIIDASFAELFAGSGSIGIEALSRGAKDAYFIEKDKHSFKTLTNNIKSLGIEKRSTLLFGDAFMEFQHIVDSLKRAKEKAFFYIDPPFSIRENHEHIYEDVTKMVASIPKECVHLIVIEHMSNINFEKQIGNFSLQKKRKFGKSSLSYYA